MHLTKRDARKKRLNEIVRYLFSFKFLFLLRPNVVVSFFGKTNKNNLNNESNSVQHDVYKHIN